MGRAKAKDPTWNGPVAELVLRVEAGGRTDPASVAKSGAAWSSKVGAFSGAGTSAVHKFTTEAPHWLLISRKPSMNPLFPR